MAEFLLELFSEEIPARMQAQAARDLARMARERLTAAELAFDPLETFAGPRRLTLVVDRLPLAQPDRVEERKGPRTNAPEQALNGFLRSTGLKIEQLDVKDGAYFARIERPGRPTPDILAEMVEAIVRGFPWPKSMRWGSGALRWVRPLQRILAVFDGAVVPLEIEGIASSDLTEGHRFMGGDHAPFAVTDFASYRAGLAKRSVVLEAAERRRRILEGARAVSAAEGLELVEDEGLLEEVAGLAEWPVPLLGHMDAAFLDLPGEVIRTSMRTHQRYFAVRDARTGGLAPRFVVVSNVEATDGGAAIKAGNARVLSARLNDARYFWDEDRREGNLDRWLERLKGVTFHAKLGTMHERVERITALAREIAPLVGADPDVAAEAARLCKADLASAMVGEFPELQGIMGGYYAREAGLLPEIAEAVRDHYKPIGPSDSVPTAPVTVAVALADKLDTLVGFFAIDEKPNGSRDPFALRRAALGTLKVVVGNMLRLSLSEIVRCCALISLYSTDIDVVPAIFNSARDFGTLEDSFQVVARLRLSGVFGFILGRNLDYREYMEVAGAMVRREAVDINRYYGTKVEEEAFKFIDWLQTLCIEGREYKSYSDPADIAEFEATQREVVKLIEPLVKDLLVFFADRLKVQLREEGKRHDLVDAVFALGDDDLVRIVRRVEALDGFLKTEDGAALLAGYRRAANILKAEAKKSPGEDYALNPDLDLMTAAEEKALAAALRTETGRMDQALEAEDFEAAMRHLSHLRTPVDNFFDKVLVNDADPAVRLNRLRLLAQVRDTANRVADFSLIAG